MRPSASLLEIVLAQVALAALGLGILGLAAGVSPRVATVDVVVSFLAVTWLLGRGLTR